MTFFVDEKAMGNVMLSIFFPVVPHCLLTADGDNPYRGIGPSGIVCFSILDAYSTWSCALVTNRIRIDGAA